MNQQLIDAFHACNTIADILKVCDEATLIQAIRAQFPRVDSTLSQTDNNRTEIDNNCAEADNNRTEVDINRTEVDDSSKNVELSEEQRGFMRLALGGENIFLTAAAGAGKSYVIDKTVIELRSRYDTNPDIPSRVAVCASTGKAASLINGRTIHSYLGIGLAKQDAEALFEKLITVRRLKPKYKELLNLRVLIVDEISMINNILLDKISDYLSLIKKNHLPFGGVQMIFVGDLCQLAPVEGKYCIDARSYAELCPIVIQFTQCFRQRDPKFQQILAEARVGKLSQASFDVLMKQNSIDESQFPNMRPMLICSTNREVDAINQRELNKLSTDQNTYAIRPISLDKKKIEISAKQEGIPEQVDLAVDAQIIITTNISMGGGRTIANGTQGKIVSMHESHINASLVGWRSDVKIGFQKVIDPDCIDPDVNPIYIFEYLPVRLGWATSIHRAQGTTCSLLEVDLNRVFAAGQAYVAISRVQSLAGLKITGLKRNAFIADPKIIEFYAK